MSENKEKEATQILNKLLISFQDIYDSKLLTEDQIIDALSKRFANDLDVRDMFIDRLNF